MIVRAKLLAIMLVSLPLAVIGAPANNARVDRQPNFDATRYMGKWYEIYRTKNMPFEFGTDNEANYALNPNGTVAVRNLEWRYVEWADVRGIATVVDNARLSVDFFMGPPGDYQVLQTDYETYAIVYSDAGSIGPLKVHFGWILAREKTLPQTVIDQAFEVFEEQTGLKKSQFSKTQHGVAPNPPPSARKQEQKVDRQPNFDATRYMGKWYEIYRTKNMPFEFGTDNEANYALNANGTVAVRNLEWRYVEWAEARAVATVVDNARLSVDFFMGPPGDYQVLQTDYETYAIVYSDAGSIGPVKLHFGWILAREKTLPQTVIDQAFEVFEEQTGLKKSQFSKTQHGVAPYPPPEGKAKSQ